MFNDLNPSKELIFENLIVPSIEDGLKNIDSKLYELINLYISRSNSTGCNWIDYVTLYKNIRRNKYKEIFEAGTGVSTLVIAYALCENHMEEGIHNNPGKVTSMEELPKYFNLARKLMPKYLRNYVDIICSETVQDYYSIFTGMRYKDIPDKPYDFCWIDGPDFKVSKRIGRLSCCFDFIHILKNSDKPISGFVDGRSSTVYTLQNIFGENVIKFINRGGYLGIINSAKREDLEKLNYGKFYLERIK